MSFPIPVPKDDVAVVREALTPEREGSSVAGFRARRTYFQEALAEIDTLRSRLATVEAERDEEAQQQRYQRQRAVEAEHRELAALARLDEVKEEGYEALLNAERYALEESEALVAQRDAALAHAERMAEALRKIRDGSALSWTTRIAREALRQWDEKSRE